MGAARGERDLLERRDAKRVDINTPVTLCMEDFEVDTWMINYSKHGALFRVVPKDQDRVSTDELGKDATFVLKVKDKPDRRYTGEIIRFYRRGEDKYIALRFWDGYEELR
jgi:hypothetical protein